MSTHDIAKKVHEETGLSIKDSQAAISAFLEAVKSEVSTSGEVRLSGFGIFSKKETKARTGRNPKTGEAIKIAASHRISFRPGKAFSESVK